MNDMAQPIRHRHLERLGQGIVEQFEAMDGGWEILLGRFAT